MGNITNGRGPKDGHYQKSKTKKLYLEALLEDVEAVVEVAVNKNVDTG